MPTSDVYLKLDTTEERQASRWIWTAVEPPATLLLGPEPVAGSEVREASLDTTTQSEPRRFVITQRQPDWHCLGQEAASPCEAERRQESHRSSRRGRLRVKA